VHSDKKIIDIFPKVDIIIGKEHVDFGIRHYREAVRVEAAVRGGNRYHPFKSRRKWRRCPAKRAKKCGSNPEFGWNRGKNDFSPRRHLSLRGFFISRRKRRKKDEIDYE